MEKDVVEDVAAAQIKENEKRMRQERMLFDYRELICKITNLENFVGTDDFKKLEDEDKELLTKQHGFMCNYADILVMRILREMK